MSFKLAAEYAKAVVSAAAGLPRNKPLNDLGLGRMAAALELLSKSAEQATFDGLKTVVETINDKLAEIEGEVAEEGILRSNPHAATRSALVCGERLPGKVRSRGGL
jgi:hypothetical protein